MALNASKCNCLTLLHFNGLIAHCRYAEPDCGCCTRQTYSIGDAGKQKTLQIHTFVQWWAVQLLEK